MIPASKKLRATLACLGAAGVLGLAPGSAVADRYVVDHCTNLTTGAAGVSFGSVSGVTSNTCGTPNGALLKQQGAIGANVTTAIELLVPADRPNIAIERVQTRYQSPGTVAPAMSNGFAFMAFTVGQQIANNDVSGRPATREVDSLLPAGARRLNWSLYCTTLTTCRFASDFSLRVFSTRLSLNEGVAPTLTVTGGTLPGAGTKTGPQSVAFDTKDGDSGVASATVSLGSTPVGSVAFPCAYADWSACPRERADQVLQVDTANAPDGTHEAFLTIRDAANNPLTRSLGTVTVHNGRPGAANGDNPSREARITARYATTKARMRRLRYAAQPTVRGRLVDDDRKPITNAAIAVLSRARRAGAARVQVATLKTGADGRFAYTLRRGPSRTLTFAYRAYTGDRRATTSSTLRTAVRAIVSARLTARTLRAGGRITMTGRLRLLGREGIEVKIQGLDRGRWRPVGEVRTRRNGTFSWSYRFSTRGGGKIYAFRARVASPIYPFAATNSPAMRVTVR